METHHNINIKALLLYRKDFDISWITNVSGEAIQHLQPACRRGRYLPFGEDFIYQRTTSWGVPYTFSGKVKDKETGYSYFGARYYSPELSVWLSRKLSGVDPLADKVIGEMHIHATRNAAPSAADIYGLGMNKKGRQLSKFPINYVAFVVTKKTVFAIVIIDPVKYEAYRKKYGLAGLEKLYEEGKEQTVSAGNNSDYEQTLGGAKNTCGSTSESGISLYRVWNKGLFGKKSKWVKINED